MKKYRILSSLFAALLCSCAGTENATPKVSDESAAVSRFDVAAFVWPAYQPEPRWKELKIFSHGCGEWQNVYEAKPKYKGDPQPKVPYWGYENEANPIVVARKIDAALAAGINVFIYDWYWYQNRPFLENALNEGFLKAPNNERMKFFIMWANHDVNQTWDNKVDKSSDIPLLNADVSYDEFTMVLVPRFVNYFKKPNYYKIGGKPVFSVYHIANLARGMGGFANAKKAFVFLDSAAKNAGLKGVHFMTICAAGSYGRGADLPNGKKNASVGDIAEYLGFDSHTTYNWVHENSVAKEPSYDKWVDMNVAKYDKIDARIPSARYFPHVSIGWDTNPRFPLDAYKPSVRNSNPRDFERALRAAKAWIETRADADSPKLVTVNAWNEWTEGCMLEPDENFGYDYLNAAARVFGGSGR